MFHLLYRLHPRRSLVARLSYAFAGVSLILSVVLGFYAAESSRRQIEQDEGQRFVSEARDVIDVLDRGMFERYREMQVVAKLDDIRQPDVPVEKKREVLEGLQHNFDAYAWIGVCDLQGKGMVGTGKYLEGKDLSKRPWCSKGREQPFVGDVHDALLLAKLLPNPSGQPFYLVDVAAPVTDLEGRSQGVLCGHIYWKWAEEALDSRKHDGLEIFLLNRDGLILAGPQGYRTDFAKLAPRTWQHMAQDAAQADHLLDTWQDGKRYLIGHAHDVGYRDYPGLGWVAVVRQDAEAAFAPAKALQRRILLVGLALGVLFTLVGAWAARRISRPISRIAEAAEQVAAGDLQRQVPLARGDDEVAHLSQAIHTMVRNLTAEILERKRAEGQLRLSAVVFANNSEAIVITDAANNIVRVNAAFERISGYSEAEVLGKNPRMFASGRMSPQFYQEMWAELMQQDGWRGEIWNKRRNREVYPEWLILSLVRDEQGRVINHIAIYSDITERKREEARIQFLASHDVLTGLPNRFLLTDRLTQALAAAEHNGLRVGVMFIDLDHFKNINDSLGHDVGDDLLKQVAERMQRCLRRTDTLARLGGDEFVVLLPDVGSENEIAFLAEKLLESFAGKFLIQDYQLSITPSLGISIYPEDGQDARELLRNADVAMYRAKKDGRNTFQFYRPEMTVNITERLHMEMQLRHAVENRELFVLYQPQICLASGKIAGMEALVRWQHLGDTGSFHSGGGGVRLDRGHWRMGVASGLHAGPHLAGAGLRTGTNCGQRVRHTVQSRPVHRQAATHFGGKPAPTGVSGGGNHRKRVDGIRRWRPGNNAENQGLGGYLGAG